MRPIVVAALLCLALPASADEVGLRIGASGGLANYLWHTVAPFAVDVTYRLGPVELGLESSAAVMSGSDAHLVSACWGLAIARAGRSFGTATVFVQGGAGRGVLLASQTSDTVLSGRGGLVARLEGGIELPGEGSFLELAGGVVSFGNVATGDAEDGWPDASRGVARLQMLTFRLGAGVRF